MFKLKFYYTRRHIAINLFKLLLLTLNVLNHLSLHFQKQFWKFLHDCPHKIHQNYRNASAKCHTTEKQPCKNMNY